MKNTKLKLISALLLMMAVGFGQTAQAATKTVSYNITNIEPGSGLNPHVVTITRTGDTPFDGSNTTTYTINVNNNGIFSTYLSTNGCR